MKKYILTLLLTTHCLVCFSAEKLTVLLDWFANPDHAPLFVAQENGYFQQQGLEVELIGPSDPSDPPKLVAAGKADIAVTYQPNFSLYMAQTLPLIQIGTLINQPLNCLVVLKSSAIKSIADLKGKRIGYSNDGTHSLMLKTMLAKYGLTLNDVESINVHYDLTQALLSGKVDAVTGVMRNFELIQMALVGQPGRAFYPEQNGMKSYSELIFVVQKDKASDPRFKKFFTALKQGVVYLKSHPEEAWKQFAKAHAELNDELNHKAWMETVAYFPYNPTLQ